MTVNINLSAKGTTGTNFNADLKAFIDQFTSTGFPYQEEDDQMIITGSNAGQNTKIFVLDGENYSYDMGTHTVGGTLHSIQIGTLGKSLNADGSFKTDAEGHIRAHAPSITISGLDVSNPNTVRGDFHELVAELMYLGGSSERGVPTFNEIVFGEAHNVRGSSGNDTYVGTKFNDRVSGNGGNDKLSGGNGNDILFGNDGADVLRGGNGNDKLDGGAKNDNLFGDAGSDQLFGGDGNDKLNGGDGNDKLTGGAGADQLSGGAGADQFIYTTVSESFGKSRDTILDFDASDRVNLSAIDADTTTAGNQAFRLVSNFTGDAGELRRAVVGADTYVQGDIDGDGSADISILVKNYTGMLANDFIF